MLHLGEWNRPSRRHACGDRAQKSSFCNCTAYRGAPCPRARPAARGPEAYRADQVCAPDCAHRRAAARERGLPPGPRQPGDRGKGLPLQGGSAWPARQQPPPLRGPPGTPPPRRPGRAGSTPTSRGFAQRPSGAARQRERGARRRPGRARPALPCPASAGPARAPSPGCPRGPLAAMTAPGRPAGLHPSGRGPGGDPERRGPLSRDQSAEGALPPGGNWTLTGRLRPPDTGRAGSSTTRKPSGPPFPALPARQP